MKRVVFQKAGEPSGTGAGHGPPGAVEAAPSAAVSTRDSVAIFGVGPIGRLAA